MNLTESWRTEKKWFKIKDEKHLSSGVYGKWEKRCWEKAFPHA